MGFKLKSAKRVSKVLTVFMSLGCLQMGLSQESSSTSKSLYMIQKPFESRGDLQLGYGYGFMNPYENLHHVVLKANYRYSPNWQFGLAGSYINAVKNDATKTLEASLGSVQIKTEFQNPEYSLHATFASIPLSGLLNFFSKSVVPFDLVFGAKAGITQYKKSGIAPSFGPYLEYKTYFFDRLGVYFGIEYTVEHLKGINNEPAVWVSQNHIGLGATWTF